MLRKHGFAIPYLQIEQRRIVGHAHQFFEPGMESDGFTFPGGFPLAKGGQGSVEVSPKPLSGLAVSGIVAARSLVTGQSRYGPPIVAYGEFRGASTSFVWPA